MFEKFLFSLIVCNGVGDDADKSRSDSAENDFDFLFIDFDFDIKTTFGFFHGEKPDDSLMF